VKRSFTTLLALFTIVGPGSAFADTTTNVPDCGYLNVRGCSPIDNEGYNIYFGIYTVCDFGLYMNIHGKCVNSTRVTKDDDHSWAAWALGEQRDNIGTDAPLNMVVTFGTHN